MEKANVEKDFRPQNSVMHLRAGDSMQARSLLFDLWGDYIQHVGGEVRSSTLARYLAEFGISEATLRQTLSRMIRQGWLSTRKVSGRSCYSLTERGRRRLVEASRRVYHPEETRWDGSWRLLCYSIPEANRATRDDLRKELAWTGFAHLTPGTWISPNPLEEAVQELVRRYDLGHYATIFVARHTGPESPTALVQRCWDLAAIQARYDRFLEHWGPRCEQYSSRMDLTDDRCFVEKIELVHDYRKFLFVDPGLPQDLLPEEWRGLQARRLFQRYYALLQPGALRFMDRALEPISS